MFIKKFKIEQSNNLSRFILNRNSFFHYYKKDCFYFQFFRFRFENND